MTKEEGHEITASAGKEILSLRAQLKQAREERDVATKHWGNEQVENESLREKMKESQTGEVDLGPYRWKIKNLEAQLAEAQAGLAKAWEEGQKAGMDDFEGILADSDYPMADNPYPEVSQ